MRQFAWEFGAGYFLAVEVEDEVGAVEGRRGVVPFAEFDRRVENRVRRVVHGRPQTQRLEIVIDGELDSASFRVAEDRARPGAVFVGAESRGDRGATQTLEFRRFEDYLREGFLAVERDDVGSARFVFDDDRPVDKLTFLLFLKGVNGRVDKNSVDDANVDQVCGGAWRRLVDRRIDRFGGGLEFEG